MTRELLMAGGLVALIDDGDVDLVRAHNGRAYKWSGRRDCNAIYVQAWQYREGGRKKITLHQLLLNAPRGTKIDHINGNGLDNRRANLRLCTNAQNSANQRKQTTRKGKRTYSEFKGVSWRKDDNRWTAQVGVAYHLYHLGFYSSETEAALAYNKAATFCFGPFAKLNMVTHGETNA
jgi:hypothetical protein